MLDADRRLYPLFVNLAGRRVLVAGAGAVATRKIAALIDIGARVCVVAPKATDDVERLAREGAIEWRARPFQSSDVDGAWLVIAATSDGAAQRAIAAEGEARRVFVVAVNGHRGATACSGAIVRRDPLLISISSSGSAPALSRLIREILEQVLPAEDWIEHAKRMRAKWIEAGTPSSQRFGELVKELAARARVRARPRPWLRRAEPRPRRR
jgi:uroporphyrin-III C-methyltransferase/precorrin-2 dehydrogenase/sirohydrochlorin ferrochelatase